MDHVVDARVRKLRQPRVLRDQLEVVAEGAFPGERRVVAPQLFEPRRNVELIASVLLLHSLYVNLLPASRV